MVKHIHEIRDPIHVFIRMNTDERRIVDSSPFQRLRHIHQLALTYLTYPGATHKRFEHSLGVMELAGRVFDVITHKDAITDHIRDSIHEIGETDKLAYWKQVLRIAALCHDIGHLPFSHAAEKELLPDEWDHERLTKEIILSDTMKKIWESFTPAIRKDDIVKLAVGPKKAKEYTFTNWETILAEIIVGDAFGVDRMDYLLRDSYHSGVAYGKFDHYRLIDTLRILPLPPSSQDDQSTEPALGIEEGGLQSAESLLFARYFMYSQVYFHHVRRIYDIHLKDFLKAWLKNGMFSTDISEHLKLTDNEIISAIRECVSDSSKQSYIHASRIENRKHFKVLYQRNPNDVRINPDAARNIYEAAQNEFGQENIRFDSYTQKSGAPDFPVSIKDGRIVSSLSLSKALEHLPLVSVEYIFIESSLREKAQIWLDNNRTDIIKPETEVDEE